MKFNLKLTNNSTYAEVGQINPLRWKTLFLEKDGVTFTDQSGWIKCKDFFNDTLAYFKAGTKFSIYSYKNDVKKNDEGVFFLLKEVKDRDTTFMENMNVMNARLQQDLGCEVSVWPLEDKSQCIVLLPNPIWESTYVLSLVTMLIRCCNYGYKYEKWDDFYHSQAPMNNGTEHAFTPQAKAFTQKHGFLVPKEFRKYWWYFSKDYNSDKMPKATGGTIHNNGACQWVQGMTQGA